MNIAFSRSQPLPHLGHNNTNRLAKFINVRKDEASPPCKRSLQGNGSPGTCSVAYGKVSDAGMCSFLALSVT